MGLHVLSDLFDLSCFLLLYIYMYGALYSLVPFISMINQSTLYSSISECHSKIQHKKKKCDWILTDSACIINQ